jgi:hypothetical protein
MNSISKVGLRSDCFRSLEGLPRRLHLLHHESDLYPDPNPMMYQTLAKNRVVFSEVSPPLRALHPQQKGSLDQGIAG